MGFLSIYLLIGLLFAMYCWLECLESDIPWSNFIITIFVWPYTLYLAIRDQQ
jgi:hypothetical protein